MGFYKLEGAGWLHHHTRILQDAGLWVISGVCLLLV